ncbi:MAG: hypothetical protein CVV51_00480 [Spirochaetae bacterium HGW-Spirochaetae-7]|nr:MAG: hypothetical protein CVV51_00480 [Spirochaetae bacterium HGW-Spirochaetae-7]
MKKTRSFRSLGLLATVLGISAIFLACSQPANPDLELDSSNPTVVSTIAADNATGVAINKTISATFDESMDSSTIVADNFTVFSPTEAVVGSVTYDKPNKRAIFAPSANLAADTLYTATVKTGTLDLAGNSLAQNKVWTFTTALNAAGPAPVSLGTAGNYAILAKSAISTVPSSDITGDVGLSPAAESYMTGFSQTDATGYATSPQVTGFLYAADMTPPTPTYMTTAISDMELAYTDAAGRILPDYLELGTGAIGGLTLVPGLYKWTNSVTMASDVAISGDANDVWILQIDGNLSSSSATRITLSGGAQASNIFWQVAGEVTLGTTSHFEGIILSKTAVTMNTGATMNGRILAQTNVALDQATVTEPAF